MKKEITVIVVAIGFCLSAFLTSSAMAGSWGLGVIATGTQVSATGNETETTGDKEVTSTKEEHNAGLGSIFVEYTVGESQGHGFTFGASYSPMKGQLGARTRTDTVSDAKETSTDTGTYTAKANVSNHSTFYVEPTLMWDNWGVFVKGGLARIKVESLETIDIGTDSSVYPDSWANGLLLGFGFTNRLDSGLFYKLEAVSIRYNDINLASQSGNKNIINASVDQLNANFAIGYRF